jgi:hypothetical protein
MALIFRYKTSMVALHCTGLLGVFVGCFLILCRAALGGFDYICLQLLQAGAQVQATDAEGYGKISIGFLGD